jgi:hypothetical protein
MTANRKAEQERLQAALGPRWKVHGGHIAPRGRLRLLDFDLCFYVVDAAPGPGPHRWTLWDARHDFTERELDVEVVAKELRTFVGEDKLDAAAAARG